MKILVVSQQFYPEEFRINEITKELVLKGHDVTVLTGLPNYPSGVIPKKYKFFRNRKENIFGAKIIRTFEIARKNSALGLILNYISFMFSSSFKAVFMKKDFDIIYVYQLTPVTMLLPGIIIKKIKRIPLFCYTLDLWPESVKNIIKNEKNIIFKTTDFISRVLYKSCDKIGVTSKSFTKYFVTKHSIQNNKLIYLPQHSERYTEDLTSSLDHCVDFMFMGNIGKAQDYETILFATKKIEKKENFKVHFVGEGSEYENCKLLTKELDIEDKIIFHGRHPVEDMPKFYKLADACLLTLKGGNEISLTLPAKLQGYMSAGKPIIAAIDGSAQEVIRDSGSGYYVNAGDVDGLSEIIERFIGDTAETKKSMGENSRKYFENEFSIEKHLVKLEKILNSLIKK